MGVSIYEYLLVSLEAFSKVLTLVFEVESYEISSLEFEGLNFNELFCPNWDGYEDFNKVMRLI